MGIETKKYTELHSQGAVQEQVDYIASELRLTYKAVMEVEYKEVYVLRCTDDH